MKKIILIGSGGSGKSLLARQLGNILGIEVYHLDAIFWKPGWVGTPKEEQRKVVRVGLSMVITEVQLILDCNLRIR